MTKSGCIVVFSIQVMVTKFQWRGLALIHRNSTEISVEGGTGDGQTSFKYAIWKLSIKYKNIILVGVYCPWDLTTVNEFHDYFFDSVGNQRLK